MDQPRKVAKPARGQLDWEIKCPCACIRGKYIALYMYRTAVCIYLFIYQVYVLFGDSTFVHGSLLYMHICVTRAVCMYKYKVVTYSIGKDQPDKVVNPACGQRAEQRK